MPKRNSARKKVCPAVKRRLEHGTRTTRGSCSDCSQGLLILAAEGFEYWNEDGAARGFWFCRYCGSNHVTVTDDDGESIQQGDLYAPDGTSTF
jgi:hypothetical protein